MNEVSLEAIRNAIDANRIDLYLQPIVTLPRRKVRFYEAMSRLRSATGETVHESEFVPQAERGGLMPFSAVFKSSAGFS
jgi:cyclic-di-GMP phosphodiesterase TipF (flagellum assembly factor)